MSSFGTAFYKSVILIRLFSSAPLAVHVGVNRCLDTTVAGGVQISGLHATVAPRRQQQQRSPTLEEFVFVPHVVTECLTANSKLSERLRLCKGTDEIILHTPWLRTVVTEPFDVGELRFQPLAVCMRV